MTSRDDPKAVLTEYWLRVFDRTQESMGQESVIQAAQVVAVRDYSLKLSDVLSLSQELREERGD